MPGPAVGGIIGFYCGQAGHDEWRGSHFGDWPKLFRGGPAKMSVGVVVASAIVLTSSIAEKRKWSRASKSLIMPLVLCTCVVFTPSLPGPRSRNAAGSAPYPLKVRKEAGLEKRAC